MYGDTNEEQAVNDMVVDCLTDVIDAILEVEKVETDQVRKTSTQCNASTCSSSPNPQSHCMISLFTYKCRNLSSKR